MLITMIAIAVPLYVIRIKEKGGPSDEDWKEASSFSNILGERGDNLLFKSKKAGETADLFNKTAKSIAVLSFLPGGITIFGSHFETKI